MTAYWPYRLVAFLSRIMPERCGYWVGLRLADLFYRMDTKGRLAVKQNLSRIFEARGIVPSDRTMDGFARKTFQYFGKYLVDFFRFARLTPEDIRARVSIEHKDYLERALAMNRGVLVVTAHFGNWELGGAVLAGLGCTVNAVVLPQRMEKLNRLFQDQRARRGIHVIPMGRSPFSLVRCLKRKECLALLADRDYSGRNDLIEFFGRPARMPVGPAWLAWHTKAPVLVGFLLRQVDDSFLLRLYPPILPEQMGSQEAVRRAIVAILEKEIGEQPYQWYLFDPLWEQPATARSET